MKALVLILLVGLLASCTKDRCSKEFEGAYKDMGSKFGKLYSKDASNADLTSFRGSLENFLSKHKDVSCKLDKKEVNPTKEVNAMMAELDGMMKLIAKVVYGIDNRLDVVDSPVTRYREWADSTAAHINKIELSSNFSIQSQSLGSSIGLCQGERFYNQPTAARCSGFLVSPDTLVTAGHCMESTSDCSDHYWAFGYYKGVSKLDSEDVYSCKKVIKQELLGNGLDYAVVQLDRPVKGRKFFRIRTSGKVSDKANLVVIGYPSGLPAKIADGGKVRNNKDDNWFSSNLDTFGGNSGSAVIDSNSGLVEGILVRGEQDYIPSSVNNSFCYKVNVCSNDGCGGEEVTRMTSVKGIPSFFSFESIIDGLFVSESFPEVETGVLIKTYGYSYGGYTVSGRRFLDFCGSHLTKDGNANWESSSTDSCDSQKKVIEDFLKLVQL